MIHRYPKTDYRNFEINPDNKILLNICDSIEYNVTDSNEFWSNYYSKIQKDFNEHKPFKLGDVHYTKIFSYHIVCNMICVEWPKTFYNIKPFKINYFKKCCKKCSEYMKENNIHLIYTPVLGSKILEGNWKDILSILNTEFKDSELYIFYNIE